VTNVVLTSWYAISYRATVVMITTAPPVGEDVPRYLAKGRCMDKPYSEPSLSEWGTVTQLTQTGLTNPGADGKSGSRPSQGQ